MSETMSLNVAPVEAIANTVKECSEKVIQQ